MISRIIFAAAVVLSVTSHGFGYDYHRVNGQAETFDGPSIDMAIKMPITPTLSDGTNYVTTVQAAMTIWNAQINGAKLNGQGAPVGVAGDNNLANEIAFGAEVYPGEAFDANVLAITVSYHSATPRTDGTYRCTQADIIVNSVYTSDSYRGSLHSNYDLRRTILHELGHVLGLMHPDEATPPQFVSAIMNSRVSNLDSLTVDDIAGAQFLYNSISVPPIVKSDIYGQVAYVGQTATFKIVATGSAPLSYQWKKDGNPIGGATTDVLAVTNLTSTDAGSYSVTISNPAGTANSSNAALTVRQPTPPTVGTIPATMTVAYGEQLSIFDGAINGDPPPAIQWYKDGVAIPNAYGNFLIINAVTSADAGSYTVHASNVAGAVISNACAVTVSPPVGPAITGGPYSQTVTLGASVGLSVSASGTSPLSYQWYRNGIGIPGANYSGYSVSSADSGTNGTYTVRVSNLVGSVMSGPATITVLPPTLPAFVNFFVTEVDISSTDSLNLNAFVNVTPNTVVTYQWYKDGSPIPGANGTSYYHSPATASDAGIYSVLATNAAGSVMSPDITVRWKESPGTLWMEAYQAGNVVYFLAASPGRIMRYDLSQEAWLPIVYLPEGQVPTAFLPSNEGVFIAYGTALVRRSVDLSSETAVATSAQPIHRLFAFGNLVYYSDGTSIRSRDRSTLNEGPTSNPPSYIGADTYARNNRVVFSSTRRTGYQIRSNVSPSAVAGFTVAGDGSLQTNLSNYDWSGALPTGDRLYLSNDEQALFDNSGVVYDPANLSYRGSLGMGFDDLTFLSDGSAVALRANQLTVYPASSLIDSGETVLAAQGFALGASGTDTYVFGAPASSTANPTVTKVPKASFSVPTPSAAAPTTNSKFSISEVFLDTNGVVNLVSNSAHSVVRWSPQSHSFISPIPLLGNPTSTSYAEAIGRLKLCYHQRQLTYLDPTGDQTEHQAGAISNQLLTMVAMDHFTNVVGRIIKDVVGEQQEVLDDTGAVAYVSGGGYPYHPYVWDSASRRLYSGLFQNGSDRVGVETVPANGMVSNSSFPTNTAGQPLRLSPDGSLLLTAKGRVTNSSLAQVAQLDNTVTDGAWTSSALFTIHVDPSGTEVQKWSRPSYGKAASQAVAGIPVRILALGENSLIVVTLVDGYVGFYALDQNLTVVGSWVNTTNAPVITLQPFNTLYSVGDSVTLVVGATGGAVTYQWRKNGTPIAGATSSTLTLTSLTATDSGSSYDVIVTNGNGSATSVAAILTLKSATQKASQTITFAAIPDHVFGDEAVALSASASSGETVTFTVISGPANVSGHVLTITGAGTITVRASQAGTFSYDPAPSVDRTFTVAKATATVTLSNLNQAVDGTPRTVAVTTMPAGLAYQVTYNGSSVAPSTAGSYAVVATITDANYGGSATGALTLTGSVSGMPVILIQPIGQTVTMGGSAVFTVSATGGAPLQFQWRRGGVNLSGQNGTTLTLPNLGISDSGSQFDVVVSNSIGSVTSNSALLQVRAGAEIRGQIYFGSITGTGRFAAYLRPGGQGLILGVLPGGGSFAVEFTVDSTGSFSATLPSLAGSALVAGSNHTDAVRADAAPVLTGRFAGAVMTGLIAATGDTLTASAQASSGATASVAGLYQASIYNSSDGMVYLIVGTDGSAMLARLSGGGIVAGSTTMGSNGQFAATLGTSSIQGTLTAATGTLSGTSNGGGDGAFSFGGVAVTTPRTDRLINISTRGLVGDGENMMIAGFVISGDTPKTVLIRASGPALGGFGVGGAMENPQLKIFRGDSQILSNDDWGTSSDAAATAAAGARVGAFTLGQGSKDAAIIATLAPGVYSAQVSRLAGTQLGLTLIEVYDAGINPGVETQKLINISTRGKVGSGENILIGGFVISGNSPKKILLRAIGPTLTSYGVGGILSNPVLNLYKGSTLVLSNSGWSNDPSVAAAAAQVGAFPLAANSKDAALLLELAPGLYSAQVSGADGQSGIALLEVYEVP